jgi:hypothetical protein
MGRKMGLNFFDISNYIEPLTFKSSFKGEGQAMHGVYLSRRVPKHTVIGICSLFSSLNAQSEDFELKVANANHSSLDVGDNKWRRSSSSPIYLDEYLDDNDYVNYSNDAHLNKLIRRIVQHNEKRAKSEKHFFLRTSLDLNEKQSKLKETMLDIEIVTIETRRLMQKFKLLLSTKDEDGDDDDEDNEIKKKQDDFIYHVDDEDYEQSKKSFLLP